MTNKSEQDGESSKTIEISDMKYHIFWVRVDVYAGASHFLALAEEEQETLGGGLRS